MTLHGQTNTHSLWLFLTNQISGNITSEIILYINLLESGLLFCLNNLSISIYTRCLSDDKSKFRRFNHP